MAKSRKTSPAKTEKFVEWRDSPHGMECDCYWCKRGC